MRMRQKVAGQTCLFASVGATVIIVEKSSEKEQ